MLLPSPPSPGHGPFRYFRPRPTDGILRFSDLKADFDYWVCLKIWGWLQFGGSLLADFCLAFDKHYICMIYRGREIQNLMDGVTILDLDLEVRNSGFRDLYDSFIHH